MPRAYHCEAISLRSNITAKQYHCRRQQYGGVAQLGEHLPCKQGVMGSNPIISTTANQAEKEDKREKEEI